MATTNNNQPFESSSSDETPIEDSNKNRRWGRLFTSTLSIVFLVFIGGFVFFLSKVDSYPEAQPNSVSADGIAVLTGGFARLAPAVELIKQKQGQRLLISGVNRRNSDGSLKNALKIDDETYTCCVDLDQDALDTRGNAIGIAHWAVSKDYSTIIIVTNDYHMPRSIMEISRVLGDVELIPYAIRNKPAIDETLIVKFHRYRVLIGEYVKYFASAARGIANATSNNNGKITAGLSTGW